MRIPFDKYQGTGNDFIMIDQRFTQYLTRADTDIIAKLCDRKFGIGADGLILLELMDDVDFEMVYFNSDGNESSLCGNGARSIVKFAQGLGIITVGCEFMAIDGVHHAKINDEGDVELEMGRVKEIHEMDSCYTLDTGSPHYIDFREDIESIDVQEEGAAVRYSDRFKNIGVNVNFVMKNEDGIAVRTYERGVEGETLSCGTGVTAAALAASQHFSDFPKEGNIGITTLGGALTVKYKKEAEGFSNIWLCGPAQKVFKGVAYV